VIRTLACLAVRGIFLLTVCVALGDAHSVRVYSEFTRIDPLGHVVKADRPRDPAVRPREILSPALARNGFASFRVAVTVSPGEFFHLYVGENPENVFQITAYREKFVRSGDEWVPDGLERVELPYSARVPDIDSPVPGQNTVTFWLDVWVPHDAKVGRYKVEPQVHSENHWATYPMEVRVVPPIIPERPLVATGLAEASQPADATARRVLKQYMCGPVRRLPQEPLSVRRLIQRNAVQDVALALHLEKARGHDTVAGTILGILGATDEKAWCRAPVFPARRGPEWYLKVRDALDRMVD